MIGKVSIPRARAGKPISASGWNAMRSVLIGTAQPGNSFVSGSFGLSRITPNAAQVVVRKGRIYTSTPAVLTHNGDVMVFGSLEVWEFIDADAVTAYDEGTAYVVGNFVIHAGNLYRCGTNTTGVWDSGDWVEILDGDELIDRTAATVSVPHRLTESVPEGALVEWDEGGLRVLTCGAAVGWF